VDIVRTIDGSAGKWAGGKQDNAYAGLFYFHFQGGVAWRSLILTHGDHLLLRSALGHSIDLILAMSCFINSVGMSAEAIV
jgi:hypothetical protein